MNQVPCAGQAWCSMGEGGIIILTTITILIITPSVCVVISMKMKTRIRVVMTQVADLKTARWGRPSVGTIGGKITGDEDEDALKLW